MDEQVLLSPVTTQRASEAICAQIRDMILRGTLKPGDRLPSERAMMDMMQRSRPTIREALRMLERSGLIRITPGCSGAIVLEPSIASVEQPLENMLTLHSLSHEELLEFRELNESATVRWAAQRRTDGDLAALRACLAQAEAALDDYEEFFRLDVAFHQLISAAGQNRLTGVVDKIMHTLVNTILTNAYRKKGETQRQEMFRTVLTQHREILEAVAAQDELLARDLMRTHLRSFSDDVRMNSL